MLVMLLAVYALAWRRKVGMYVASLFAMSTFVDFNAVLFRQYFAWIVPLIPLVMLDLWEGRRPIDRPTGTLSRTITQSVWLPNQILTRLSSNSHLIRVQMICTLRFHAI